MGSGTGAFRVDFYSGHSKDLGSLRLKLEERGFESQSECESHDWTRLEYCVGGIEATLLNGSANMLCKQPLTPEGKKFMRTVHSEYWWNGYFSRESFIIKSVVVVVGGSMAISYLL